MHILRRFTIFSFIFIATAPLSAQWKLAASNVIIPIFRPYDGGGVITNHNGILWAGYKDIWMSADTGKSWSLRTPFNGFNNSCIKDISFFDDNNGLATTQNGEVYVTQDQGLSWAQHIPPNPFRFRPSIESGCFLSTPNHILACSYAGDRYISNDGGTTWQITLADSIASQVLSGNGGTAYIIGGFSIGPSTGASLSETNDFGTTWTKHPGVINWDSYSFTRDKCDTSTFYVVNDDFAAKTDKTSRVYFSNDIGSNWQSTDQGVRPHHCGSISASQNAIFVQTFSGISRSTDHGQTWQDIGGPSNIEDTRFITALDNNVVVAVDDQGSVWVTNNSGGDSVTTIDGSKIILQTADQKTDTIGGTVGVPISLNGLTGTQDVDVVVHYNPQLEYLGTYSLANVKLNIPGESWKGRSKIHIPAANSSGILANSYFNVFSDSSKKLQVTFDSVSVVTAIIPCTNSISTATSSMITPAAGCSADILTQFLRDSTLPQLRITPNPSSGDIFISSTADLADANICFYDILGNKCGEVTMSLGKNQPKKIGIQFANGMYLVRALTATKNYDLRIIVSR